MPKQLPYLPSYKNLSKLFEKIEAAKAPDAFTYQFLSNTLGLKSSADRSFIPLLKNLGFLDSSGKPTTDYGLLKNKNTARRALAAAVRNAYEPIFSAQENAHNLSSEDIKSLISQVAGTDAAMTERIAYTFAALTKLADFTPDAEKPLGKEKPDKPTGDVKSTTSPASPLRSEFHYNIQIHLPSNASEETYINIFNALRKALQ